MFEVVKRHAPPERSQLVHPESCRVYAKDRDTKFNHPSLQYGEDVQVSKCLH